MVFGVIAASSTSGVSLNPVAGSPPQTPARRRQPHDFGIAHPIGHRHHHLVARIERRHQRIEDDLLAARGDEAVLRRDIEPVVAPELGRHRFLELGDAVDIGVARLALVHRRDGGVLHIQRRIEIGLARRAAR